MRPHGGAGGVDDEDVPGAQRQRVGASWPRWAIAACRGPRVRMARVMCGHGLGPWKVVPIPGNGSAGVMRCTAIGSGPDRTVQPMRPIAPRVSAKSGDELRI